MLLIAVLVGVSAYGRVTSAWSARPFLVIGVLVAALIALAALTQPVIPPLLPLLVDAVVDFMAGVALFSLGYALGRWLDRDKERY
ncbi:hypothetical protein [Sphingomonas sp.]|uniref:hypothetical protein n=1 Tax=Sphingomonas sp. TaxID=28214 RepID=UPI003CC580E2